VHALADEDLGAYGITRQHTQVSLGFRSLYLKSEINSILEAENAHGSKEDDWAKLVHFFPSTRFL
jgi:hypothetical protein